MPEPARATDTTSNDARLVNLLGALATGVSDAVNDGVAEATGLDPAASTALIALLDFLPGGSVRRLSQVIGITHSGAVRLLDRLVDAGLVARATGEDARSRSIMLTRAGRVLARRARSARAARIARIVDDIPQRDRAVLTQLCEGVIATITRQRLEQRAAHAPPAWGSALQDVRLRRLRSPPRRLPVSGDSVRLQVEPPQTTAGSRATAWPAGAPWLALRRLVDIFSTK